MPEFIRKTSAVPSYRFSTHFHPYVEELVERLIQGSIRDLQAADTEYEENDDGTLAPRPGSARVKIDDRIVKLPDGTKVSLVDELGNETEITLPGDRVPPVPEGTQVQLVAHLTVPLPDGNRITYPSGTPATFIDVTPKPVLYEPIFTNEPDDPYGPTALVSPPYPVRDLDFTPGGAYSIYNWELFFHIPLAVAEGLSKNGRFEEAQRWFHYIFDPTDDSDGPTPERFWKVPVFQQTDVKKVEEILINLVTGDDPHLKENTEKTIADWMEAPFSPHVVARHRQTPYMYKTVTAYIDNLIDWGDSLFRRDTRESINDATQLYVLAANILGPRPQAVPKQGSVRPRTYANLREHLREFGTALVALETDIGSPKGSRSAAYSNRNQDAWKRVRQLRSIGRSLYFCVPRNDKLLRYWDDVAERLFKIRNSLSLQGIFRQLPLFEPPIDPALLAKAAAAGLDVGAVVAGLDRPLPLVRCRFLLHKAAEICQELKALGSTLLSAMEKEDGEALALARSQHEQSLLESAEKVKYGQLQEADKEREGLEKSFLHAKERYKYYRLLLGDTSEAISEKISELEGLNEEDLTNLKNMNFQIGEPELEGEALAVSTEAGLYAGLHLNIEEQSELVQLGDAKTRIDAAVEKEKIAAGLAFIPDFSANVQPIGLGISNVLGGTWASKFPMRKASEKRSEADTDIQQASLVQKMGVYVRREEEWKFQRNLAERAINQIYKQSRAADLRKAIADMELNNHKQQILQATEINAFLKGEVVEIPGASKHQKTTTKEFYFFEKNRATGLYNECFEFAFELARKAERAMQRELGNPELRFLKAVYMEGKAGLLAGEKLSLDIQRMEMAYQEQKQREYELTKHISLLQVDPIALTKLRATGECTFLLTEALFDIDCPGHYFRRIKSIALSIPCVSGPYTSTNCTLTLLKSSIRQTSQLGESDYERRGVNDTRFSDHFGSTESIVTSSGQHDTGMFETNLNAEPTLPFEFSGVISEWRLQLPANPNADEPEPLQFDYDTISDVIIHIRYTAREVGEPLRGGALENLRTQIKGAAAPGCVRLFSIRHEFPNAWARFKNVDIQEGNLAELKLQLKEEHYPYWAKQFWGDTRSDVIRDVEFYVKGGNDQIEIRSPVVGENFYTDELVEDRSLGDLRVGSLSNIPLPETPTSEFTIYFDDNSMQELWMVVTWGT